MESHWKPIEFDTMGDFIQRGPYLGFGRERGASYRRGFDIGGQNRAFTV